MKNKYTRYYLWVLLTGITTTILLGVYSANAGRTQARAEAQHTLEVYAARSESLLDSLFHKTDVLESIIITSHGEVPEETFNDLAKSLMQNKGIRSIQYLPDGTVKYCYPLEGNEQAIGGNIFEKPERRADALLAKDTKQIALSGPYELAQGGFGLVARNPIFLTGKDGAERFWGFSAIVLDLPDALEPLMLHELEREGFYYRLSVYLEGQDITISQSVGYRDKEPIVKEIQVPNHTWQLAVSPRKSWVDYLDLTVIFAMGFGITALCVIIVHMLEERNEQLKQYADFDVLTGLVNRRKFLNFMELRCRDKQFSMAVLYLDINDFKIVNDTYGHSQGDVMLIEVSRRMKRCLGEENVAARVGGDEFVISLEHCDSVEKCLDEIKRLRSVLETPVQLEHISVPVSISIGYALYPGEATDLATLLDLSDKRMYENKKQIKKQASCRPS